MARLSAQEVLIASSSATRDKDVLKGHKELQRLLKELPTTVQKRVVASAMRSSLSVMTKQIKSNIPSRYKEARKGVSHRFVRTDPRTRTTTAKSGGLVGIKKTRLKALNHKAKQKAGARRPGSGVGIGPENVHWILMGTDDRTRWKTRKGPTGAMPPHKPSIVKTAFAQAGKAALVKFQQRAKELIKTEAAKLRARA